MADIQAFEYDSLPPVIQRKYFSTLERLRLAQDAASPPPSQGFHSRKVSSAKGRLDRPRTSTGFERRHGNFSAGPRRLQKAQHTNEGFQQSQAEASWFFSLPRKVQQRQFTREEQVLYAGNCETVILDAADEAFYKVNQTSDRSMYSVASSSNAYDGDRTSWFCEADEPERGTFDLGEEAEDSFRWMEKDDGLDLRLKLHDYHKHMVSESTSSQEDNSKKSFRRTLSLSSNPFARSSTSSDVPPTPSIEKIHFRNSGRFTNTPPVLAKHASKASTSTVDADATYYQDPEARLKLRVYLASPQKFDEAIEFGFPSTDSANQQSASQRPSPGLKRLDFGADSRTFFRDDNASLFDDDDASSEDMDLDYPLTPRDMDTFRSAHRLPSSSKATSTDSTAPSHLAVRKPGDTYAHALAGSREMTLRMTLTRPDLRADETALYGWQNKGKDDPLALEGLSAMAEDVDSPVMMRGPFDGPDGWGPPPKEDGAVKKFWRRVTTPTSKKV